jgi:uncharacterized protein with HEPN domain
MLDHGREALVHVHGKSRKDLEADRLRHLAVVHLVEIIGEAASRVSPAVQSEYPDIPWREIVGTRNRLIHGYDNIDDDQLWKILDKDLPDLIIKLEKRLGKGTPDKAT